MQRLDCRDGEVQMKRPGPVMASIMVISILLVMSILILYSNLFGATIISCLVFTISSAAAAVDVIFLLIRKRWVYYYNLVMVGLTILFFVITIILSNIMFGLMITITIIYLVPIVLLSWLFVELIKRTEIKEYISQFQPTGDASE